MNNFDEYISNFKQMSLKEKQEIVIEELKVLSSLSNKMCEEIGASNELLVNKELLDLNKKDYSEDDFAEASIVYIESIIDSLCPFSNALSDINSKL